MSIRRIAGLLAPARRRLHRCASHATLSCGPRMRSVPHSHLMHAPARRLIEARRPATAGVALATRAARHEKETYADPFRGGLAPPLAAGDHGRHRDGWRAGRAQRAGPVPDAGHARSRLEPRDLRPRAGAAEPAMGHRPALHRHDRRPLRLGARDLRRRRALRARPGGDGAGGHARRLHARHRPDGRHRAVGHRLRGRIRRARGCSRPSIAAGRSAWPAPSAASASS